MLKVKYYYCTHVIEELRLKEINQLAQGNIALNICILTIQEVEIYQLYFN